MSSSSDRSTPNRTLTLDGERVRALRLQLGMTREGLSAKSGGTDALSVATIKRAEAGKPIYAASGTSLARLLGVTLSQLLPALPPNSLSPPAVPTSPSPPSIAVMPFVAEGIPDAQVLASGFVEDIINRLSSTWFPVIARASSFSWEAEPSRPAEAPRILGATYALNGSIRSDGNNYRIASHLVDVELDRIIWGGTFTASPTSLFDVRERIVCELVSEVGARVLQDAAARANRIDPFHLDAWHLAIRGAWHFHRSTPDDLLLARTHLGQALRLDPELAFARYLIVLAFQHELLNQWTHDIRSTIREMHTASLAFERACPGNVFMYVATAYACVATGDRSEAEARLVEALDLDPNSIAAHSLYGQVLAMGGLCDQGIHELQLAQTLSPRDPAKWTLLMTTALAHFGAGRYDSAVQWAQRAVARSPQLPFVYAALAASLALRGDIKEAKRTLAKLAERDGHIGLRGLAPILGSVNQHLAERFIQGLRLAGVSADP